MTWMGEHWLVLALVVWVLVQVLEGDHFALVLEGDLQSEQDGAYAEEAAAVRTPPWSPSRLTTQTRSAHCLVVQQAVQQAVQ